MGDVIKRRVTRISKETLRGQMTGILWRDRRHDEEVVLFMSKVAFVEGGSNGTGLVRGECVFS